jgi:transcription elongation GreA/GreB family factor
LTFKEKVYQRFLQTATEKIHLLQKTLDDLKESGANETKSTAGDKHETALAMLQIEQANTRAQLKKAQEQKAVLEKINPAISPTAVVPGSLIKTNRGYLFLSTALGKAIVDGVSITALSGQSPLGSKLLYLKKGEIASINNNQFIIQELM